MVSQKQYSIARRIAEISTTINTGVAIPTTSSFNLPIRLMQKTDTFCSITVDYHKLNQIMTPTAAAAPDVVLFLEQINTSPST